MHRGTVRIVAAIGLLAASLGGTLAAPQGLQEIKPAPDTGLPGYVVGMAASRDGVLYTVDGRNGLFGSYNLRATNPGPAGADSGIFGGSRPGGVALADDGVLVATLARKGQVRVFRPGGRNWPLSVLPAAMRANCAIRAAWPCR